MEFKEVEQALEELESRIERLKALYEQYFMGIEKLEPLVPRKDVDRRIQILRREQVRNTAQRFKFQTLVQRYNSFQQYWARVAREIENGTYHRDVARAAARFGAKDALTIFGKKQAEKYQRLVNNQEARKARRKTTHVIDEEAMLADDELLFVDDEAEANDVDAVDDESRPTPVMPPSVRGGAPPPPPIIPAMPPLPRVSTSSMPSVPPPLPPGARVPGQPVQPVVSMMPESTQEIDLSEAEIIAVVPEKPVPVRKSVAPIRPETMIPMMMRRPSEQLPKISEPTPQEPAQRSPTIPPDPEAGKKRVAALAAQVKQRPSNSMVPQANRPLDLELDLGGRGADAPAPKSQRTLDLDFDSDPKPHDKPRPKVVSAPDRGLELDLSPPPRMREEPAIKVEHARPTPVVVQAAQSGSAGRTERQEPRAPIVTLPEVKEAPPVESSRGDDARMRLAAAARERAASAREASAREASAAGLSEARMRQIYGQYVDAKRAVKESTAGLTYDTLAKQIRQRTEKLEASNPGRKVVDYDVTMKDGKPILKPTMR